MSDAKHTPTPWELWDSCSFRRIGSAVTEMTVIEAITQRSDNHPDLWFRNEADKQFLLDAVNNYDSLKTQLSAAQAELERVKGERDRWRSMFSLSAPAREEREG